MNTWLAWVKFLCYWPFFFVLILKLPALPTTFRGWKFSRVSFKSFRRTWALEHRCSAKNAVWIAAICEAESNWDMSIFWCFWIRRDVIFRISVATICQVFLPCMVSITWFKVLNFYIIAYYPCFLICMKCHIVKQVLFMKGHTFF